MQEDYPIKDEMLYIVDWDTGNIVAEYPEDQLKQAMKATRAKGNTPRGPKAFLAKKIEVYGKPTLGAVYNPRFRQ